MPVEAARGPPSELERRLIAKRRRAQSRPRPPRAPRAATSRGWRASAARRRAGAPPGRGGRSRRARDGPPPPSGPRTRRGTGRARSGRRGMARWPRRGDDGLEPGAHATVVRGEVVVAQRDLLAHPEQHVHALRRRALDGGDPVAVEAELEDVGRLLGAGQLGIERLVAPRAEARGSRNLQQEVGAAAPPARHERGLRDHVGARPHGVRGPARRGVEVPRSAERHVHDRAPLLPQALEVRALVLLALPPEEVALLVGQVRARPLPERHLERERGEVGALDVIVQVGGGEDDLPGDVLHRLPLRAYGCFASRSISPTTRWSSPARRSGPTRRKVSARAR